jgi:membrane protein
VGAVVRLLSAVLVVRQVLQGPDETRPRRRRIPSSYGMSGGPDVPGGRAATPTQVPPRGWWQILRRAFAEGSKDNVSMLAGGVAFFGFLAIIPALIALVSLYGLIADPAQVAATLESLSSALPASAQSLVADQIGSVVSAGTGSLTTGLVI